MSGPLHPEYKSKWCEFVWRSRGCRWGSSCYHAHTWAEYEEHGSLQREQQEQQRRQQTQQELRQR